MAKYGGKKAAAPKKATGAQSDVASKHGGGIASIAETLRSIKTKFGDDSIMTLDESKKVDIDAIPSGSVGLDDALGIGG